MRRLNTHLMDGESSPLAILAMDHDQPIGPCYRYDIVGFDASSHPDFDPLPTDRRLSIVFQKGDVAAGGHNGVTMQALLAVVKDNLENTQLSTSPSDEEGMALAAVTNALNSLHRLSIRRFMEQRRSKYAMVEPA